MQRRKHVLNFVILCGLVYTFFSFSISTHENPKQVWKIEKITYSYEKSENGGRGVAKSGIENNAGTFILNDDNTGSYSYILDGVERKGIFKQHSSSPKTFVYSSVIQKNEFVVYNTYTLIENESGKMAIRAMESTVDKGAQYILNAVFYLSNKTGN